MSRHFDYLKNPRMLYIVEEHLNLYGDLGVTVGTVLNIQSRALMKHIS